MEEQPDKKKLLHTLLTGEGVLFLFAGFVLTAKPYFSDITFIDEDTDLYLGYALVLVGTINIFIANKFFNNKDVL